MARVGKLNREGLQKLLRNPAMSPSLEGRSVSDDGRRSDRLRGRLSFGCVPSAFGNSGLAKDSK